MRTVLLRRLGIATGALACATVLAACGGPSGESPSGESPSGESPSGESPTPGDTQATPPTEHQPPPEHAGQVSRQQAGDLVTDRYGGRIINVESDSANGKPTWEVEVAESEQGRIEVNVRKDSGEVVDFEHD